MFVVDAVVVLFLVAAVVLAGGVLVTRSQARSTGATALGSRELAQAMRLLDQIRAVDDAVPQLPSALRSDVDRAVTTYYKEIGR